jgi:predicted negative regulator of RcsB-dependent stress response
MSDIQKPANPAAAAKPERPIPENLPEELLPVYDWWHAQGKQTVYLAVLVLALVGAGLVLNQSRKAKALQAAEQLLSAQSTEELEKLGRQYGRTGAGVLSQLLLAKNHYDAGRYDDALAGYAAFLKRKPSSRFADIAVLGQAHALEAKGEIDTARAAFAAFRQNNPGHYLTPQAFMGEARCLAIAGDKKAAAELLDLLIASQAGTPWEERAEELKAVLARYEKRAPVSLFDQASALLPGLATNAAATAALTPPAPETAVAPEK